MMEELETLRMATIKAMLNAENVDKSYLVINGRGTFSRREIAKEIELKTEMGNSMIKNIVLLAVDLMLRQKREI